MDGLQRAVMVVANTLTFCQELVICSTRVVLWFTDFNHKEQTSMMEYVVHELHVFLSYPTSSGSTPYLTSEFLTHQLTRNRRLDGKALEAALMRTLRLSKVA